MYYPSLEEFRVKAVRGNLVPVYREILADMETPVSALRKIDKGNYAFLLESVEGGENIAQYSFLGSNPSLIFWSKNNTVKLIKNDETIQKDDVCDPMEELKALMDKYQPVNVKGLPRFHGGAVGYVSYDMVRFFEELPDANPDVLGIPDCFFMLTDTILVFDHVNHKIKVVSNAHIDGGRDAIDEAYNQAVAQIDEIIKTLKRPLEYSESYKGNWDERHVKSNFTQQEYEQVVESAKEYIKAGDIVQVVPSQRLSVPVTADPFDVYRSLRTINPSPYMYYLKMDDIYVAGSSPEVMVRTEDGKVTMRPIAGTARRGASDEEDAEIAEELLADPKEQAEHVMLVDLGRNDVGRACEYGTVHVDELMVIEKYSHVMHIVSNVVGKLRSDRDAFDVLRACLPAGTVSGAPKIRAMEIIDELEPSRRGIYAGAVGYFSFSGNSDTAIAIRTILMKDGVAHVQAGGGIVADSVPDKEYQETMNKARACMKAIQLAEEGLE
ncbi:anthranilate synthase component I [Candidatus Poribacteria bacterium]|nr:anthranilate synthase component I [Candidatus Poribacteria bacterium]